MTDAMLENYFATNYGPVQNCKVAKDPNGKSKTYGFVWFKEGRHANRAMLDSKGGKCPFKLDWYKILALRQINNQTENAQSAETGFLQIYIKWRKKNPNLDSAPLSKSDLLEWFGQFGKIVDMDFHFEQNRALVAFNNHFEAQLAIFKSKFDLKGYSVAVRPADQKRNIHLTKYLSIRDQNQAYPSPAI